MDGQIHRRKQNKKRSTSCKNSYKRRVDRCIAENTFVCQNRGLCVCETESERLMDGLVYTARGVQRGVGRGICMIRGGHGWSDVIDLTGHMSPEERERFR